MIDQEQAGLFHRLAGSNISYKIITLNHIKSFDTGFRARIAHDVLGCWLLRYICLKSFFK